VDVPLPFAYQHPVLEDCIMAISFPLEAGVESGEEFVFDKFIESVQIEV
jgi:hypothetical protein